MSSVVISKTEETPEAKPVDMKLEVVLLDVSDVDRTKAFYENLGWRLDIDVAAGGFRGVQITPHNSEASIIFGKGLTSAKSGSAPSLVLAVNDIDSARDDLLARGVDVSEVFHYAAGPFNNTVDNPRVVGRDPQGRSYFSFASFEDPDGTAGSYRRFRCVLRAASGSRQHHPWTSQTLQRSCAKQPSTMTTSRRRMPSTTVDRYAPYLTLARTAVVRRKQRPSPTATWRKSFMFLPADVARKVRERAPWHKNLFQAGSKDEHAPAKYYFRHAAIDYGSCDRGGWLRNGHGDRLLS